MNFILHRFFVPLLLRQGPLKRFLVNAIYHVPLLDMKLRTLLNRNAHVKAAIDVDASQLSLASRRIRDRIKAKTPR